MMSRKRSLRDAEVDSDDENAQDRMFRLDLHRNKRKQARFAHKMYAAKDKGTNKNYVEYDDFRVDETNVYFQIGATGAGLTLRNSVIHKRHSHSFREQSSAVTRVLTYLAENMLSCLNASGFDGLAEIQIAWISAPFNCMLITENNVTAFNNKIAGLSFDQMIDILLTKGTSKMKTQGTKEYFKQRMERHDQKLKQLLDETSKRYKDWNALDPNVAALIKFLNKTAGSKVTKLTGGENDLEQLKNNLIHYDDSCGFTGPTKHAEQYHLAVCDSLATACHAREISIPNFYIAGTKRACSTCTGTIKEYKAKTLLIGRLFVEDRYPGNLWTAQNVNQTDAAMAFTAANLKARRIHITAYKQRSKIKTTSGFNSDSESEAEGDDDDDI